jgi:hypothetical protein
MDDGNLDDGLAEIYLSFTMSEAARLIETLKGNFGLEGRIHRHKGAHLSFPVAETKKLIGLVRPFVLPLFDYKLTP